MNRLPILLLLAAAIAGCARPSDRSAQIEPDMTAPVNPWTNLDVNNGADTFQFAIVSDRTGSARPGIFEAAVDKLNLLQPEFVLCVGDLIQGYTEEQDVVRGQWDEFDALVAKLDMPFFYVAGNHDITNPVQADIWRQRLGRPYYHFRYKDVLFCILCTEDGKADQITADQVEYFRQALEQNADARWTLLFMHKPMWLLKDPSGFAAIEAELADRPYTIFGGHHHTYTKYVRNDRRYIRLATTGGSSGLSGPDYGQVDQMVWVTMSDAGPKLANLLLDGIHDENMVTEQTSQFVDDMPYEGVSIPALIAEGDILTAGTAQVHLANVVDAPIEFAATVTAPEGVTVEPGAFERMIPAGGKMTIELAISAPSGLPATGPSDILVNWRATADLPDRPQFTIQQTARVGVEPRMTCGPVAAPVTLDGKLDEWGELPHLLAAVRPEYRPAWSGPADGSLRFALTYDDQHLYVAVRVTDDEVQSDPALLYWQQDGIEIWIDPRPREARLTSRAGAERMVVGLRPGVADDNLRFAIRGVTVMADGGYTAEFAIPLKSITDPQGGVWDGIRFNIAQFDRDGEVNSQLWWRPSWRADDNYIGSGAFDRK